MNLTQCIQQRRSVRKFTDAPVSEAMIRNMLEAAICAPSASNRQPWRFMVVTDPALRGRLDRRAQAAIQAAAQDAIAGGAEEFQSYAGKFSHCGQAPVLIVCLYKAEAGLAALFREQTDTYRRMQELETSGAMISVAMAVQNLVLSATDQGLGTCVMTGPLLAEEAIGRIVAVPPGWRILCLVCVGYPDETPRPIRKKTVDQVLIEHQSGGDGGA